MAKTRADRKVREACEAIDLANARIRAGKLQPSQSANPMRERDLFDTHFVNYLFRYGLAGVAHYLIFKNAEKYQSRQELAIKFIDENKVENNNGNYFDLRNLQHFGLALPTCVDRRKMGSLSPGTRILLFDGDYGNVIGYKDTNENLAYLTFKRNLPFAEDLAVFLEPKVVRRAQTFGKELWRRSVEIFNVGWFRNDKEVKGYDWIKPVDVLVEYYGSFVSG